MIQYILNKLKDTTFADITLGILTIIACVGFGVLTFIFLIFIIIIDIFILIFTVEPLKNKITEAKKVYREDGLISAILAWVYYML